MLQGAGYFSLSVAIISLVLSFDVKGGSMHPDDSSMSETSYIGPNATAHAMSGYNFDTKQLGLMQVENSQFSAPGSLAFGQAISVVGTTAIIGAPNTSSYTGSLYIYTEGFCSGPTGPCQWGLSQTLTPSTTAAVTVPKAFGGAVSFDGTTVFVGARSSTVNGRSDQGAVYVYIRSSTPPNNMVLFQVLTPPDGAASDCFFGRSVAVNGSNAIIGAPGCGGTNATINSKGSAYRYKKDVSGNWVIAQKIVASDGGFAETFGDAVAIDGDRALVGGTGAFQFGYYGVGAVYEYSKQCFTDSQSVTRCNPGWLETQKLIGSPTSEGMSFGYSLALTGDTLLVGAPFALVGDPNVTPQPVPGAVYGFRRLSGKWVQNQQLTASDGQRNWQFGASIAVVGDKAVIGAHGAGWPSNIYGAAYVFNRSVLGTWVSGAKLEASDGASNDRFGHSVGISDHGILVGAYNAGSAPTDGVVYAYY